MRIIVTALMMLAVGAWGAPTCVSDTEKAAYICRINRDQLDDSTKERCAAAIAAARSERQDAIKAMLKGHGF